MSQCRSVAARSAAIRFKFPSPPSGIAARKLATLSIYRKAGETAAIYDCFKSDCACWDRCRYGFSL